jgi:hypothetical protein
MRSFGKSGIDRGLVAERPDVASVVRGDIVDRRRFPRLGEVDDGRELFVLHLYLLGGVARLREGLGDHHRDALADVAHLALRERRVGRLLHRLAVHVGDQPAARQAADLGGAEVLTGVHGQHALRAPGLLRVDLPDLCVGMGRTHKGGVSLVRQGDVVGVLAGAGEEAVVFLALDTCADERGVHILPPIAFAPAMMLFTMLW